MSHVSEIIAGLGYSRPHTNAATSAAITYCRFEVAPHPPYRPDLASSACRLFSCVKEHLKIIHFKCDEVQAATGKMVSRRVWRFLQQRLRKHLFGVSVVLSKERETTWKNKVYKHTTYSEL